MARRKPTNRKATNAALPIDGETERLRINMYRSDMEKLRLFAEMLRKEELFKKAVITHN